jgi:DNA-directed RNA polymerase specialized sigma24 family protein
MPVRATSTRDADFEAWLRAREPALQRTAYLLTGDPHTAADLVQVSLAKLYLAWDRVADRGSNVDAYARRILVNEHRTAWRRPVRRRELVTAEVLDRPAPEHEYDGQREAVWRFLATLPPRQGRPCPGRRPEPDGHGRSRLRCDAVRVE